MNLIQILDLINLLFFAFIINLPFGYLREASAKFSVRWFVYVHLSIPFIIAVRITDGFGWELVPFTLFCAVAGQVLGGKMYRRRKQ